MKVLHSWAAHLHQLTTINYCLGLHVTCLLLLFVHMQQPTEGFGSAVQDLVEAALVVTQDQD